MDPSDHTKHSLDIVLQVPRKRLTFLTMLKAPKKVVKSSLKSTILSMKAKVMLARLMITHLMMTLIVLKEQPTKRFSNKKMLDFTEKFETCNVLPTGALAMYLNLHESPTNTLMYAAVLKQKDHV